MKNSNAVSNQEKIVSAAMEMLESVAYTDLTDPATPWPMANEEAYMGWVSSVVHRTYLALRDGEAPTAAYFCVCDVPEKAARLLGQAGRRALIGFGVPMNDPDKKDLYGMAAKLLAGSFGARATAFVADAYVVNRRGHELDIENLGPISEHPDRSEAAVIIAESPEFDTVLAQITYTREDGKITSVDAPDVTRLGTDGSVHGRFSGAANHVFHRNDVAEG